MCLNSPETFWLEVLPFVGRDGFGKVAPKPLAVLPAPCVRCGSERGVERPTTRACPKCHAVRFCSQKCLKKAWKKHKKKCRGAKKRQAKHDAPEEEEGEEFQEGEGGGEGAKKGECEVSK